MKAVSNILIATSHKHANLPEWSAKHQNVNLCDLVCPSPKHFKSTWLSLKWQHQNWGVWRGTRGLRIMKLPGTSGLVISFATRAHPPSQEILNKIIDYLRSELGLGPTLWVGTTGKEIHLDSDSQFFHTEDPMDLPENF